MDKTPSHPTESGYYWARWEDRMSLQDDMSGLWEIVRYYKSNATIYVNGNEYTVDDFSEFIRVETPEQLKGGKTRHYIEFKELTDE